MSGDMDYGKLPPESADHFHHLDAHLVATDALMTTLDNIQATIEAKAMMCAYGSAGYGKTMSVNSALRKLAPDITYRLELRSGPTPRDIRHGLFRALGLPGEPPTRPIEFDTLLKETLSQTFRVLVCDEAQWMGRSSVGDRRPQHPAHRHLSPAHRQLLVQRAERQPGRPRLGRLQKDRPPRRGRLRREYR